MQSVIAWGAGYMAFEKSIAAGYVLFCVPKENQKGRRCPQGMKAPVGLLSRRPVCKANAACSARQGLRYFRGAGGTNQGLLALDNPKAVGLHTKNPSRCAKGFFVFRRFEAPQSLRDSSPKWEQAHPQALRSTRKLYRTAKASLMREVASPSGLDGRSSYPNYSFSRTSCGSSLKEGASGETGKLCGLPGNFTAMPRALPLGELASPTGLD